MTNMIWKAEGSANAVDTRSDEKCGEEWIQAIINKDFGHLTTLCHTDMKGTLLLPKRIVHLESPAALTTEVEDWFGEYTLIQIVQSRVAMVGEKLGIFYRLRCVGSGGVNTIEQQIYCTLGEGRIEQLRLICSGFQPDLASTATPITGELNGLPVIPQSSAPAIPQATERLEFKATTGQGSTCALLTPYIKSKLVGMSSGEVLEVHVDDTTAQEDIEAWSRLSGNLLLKMDQTVDQELVFFIQKK